MRNVPTGTPWNADQESERLRLEALDCLARAFASHAALFDPNDPYQVRINAKRLLAYVGASLKADREERDARSVADRDGSGQSGLGALAT